MTNDAKTRLARRLTLSDAIMLGLGSMIGAGIFAVSSVAAESAGSAILFSILLAGLVAYLNATSVAQLAALYPESGGAYVYGKKQLNSFFGFLAGWAFVIGKTASCTAMALTFAYYIYPQWAHIIAFSVTLLITFINYLGIKKTAWATRVLVVLVLLTLLIVLISIFAGDQFQAERLFAWKQDYKIKGILEAAGLMFFAFAGYARIATLGEEVIEPQKTIPKAIMIALAITVVLYFLVMVTIIASLPLIDLVTSSAPLALAVEQSRFSELTPLIRIGAAIASFSVLLSLIAGISRTIFAMASNGDLPRFLSAVHPRHKIPYKAEIMIGTTISLLVLFTDLRSAIGFSSFAILIYYSIANLAAIRLNKEHLLFPRTFAHIGLLICIILAINLPLNSIIGGVILFALGTIVYFFKNKFL
ncbi:MAG: amino acid permease [Bdellovibrionales bacterium]|nr:amino acid permease [Bdellovibrionales bacterium]